MTTAEHIQRLERLLEISRNLNTSLELEPFLQSIITTASELTGSEVASILELDEGSGQLRFIALPWFHREALETVKVPMESSIAGWVVQNNKSIIVPETAAEPRHYKAIDQASGFETRSLLAVPLVFKGETLGVLEAINKANQANYTEEDLAILETLACQAAIAIQNVHLTRQVQESDAEVAKLDELKSDFIAIASHELRTPLGLILGHSTYLREMIDESNREQLDIIIQNAMRLKEIIDNLASMDNVQRGKASVRRHMVSINAILKEVFESFQDSAKRRDISLRVEAGKEELMVAGDMIKISIALSNLVKNAITFTNPGGHVLIVAEQIPGYVKVSVIDDGAGIPAKDLPHIFERFFQVESHLTRKHGGMGLGLSVAKVMIEMHNGRIWAESVEGKGSNFTFLLPVDSNQADAASNVPIS